MCQSQDVYIFSLLYILRFCQNTCNYTSCPLLRVAMKGKTTVLVINAQIPLYFVMFMVLYGFITVGSLVFVIKYRDASR